MTNARAGTGTASGRLLLGRQGFGAMRLRDAVAESSDRDPVAVVHAALDASVTMVDTADAYQNEELVGRAIRRRRDDVVPASVLARDTGVESAGSIRS